LKAATRERLSNGARQQDAEASSATLTFVLTDMEKSAFLRQTSPKAMGRAQVRHGDIVAEAVKSHGGNLHLERGEGDSTFSTFPNAVSAVRAICQIQLDLAAEPWPEGLTLRVRAALHTGQASLDKYGYVGSDIDFCGRLRALAHGGQTLLSQATYALVKANLPEEVTLPYLGLHRLKDFSPQHIYQLQHPRLPLVTAPLLSLDERLKLPRAKTEFIGREHERTEIHEALATHFLVTLTGPAGSGKTRLALQIAETEGPRLADGACWVDMATLSEPEAVVEATLAVVEAAPLLGKTPMEALFETLSNRTMLLVLDNCEHLREPCGGLIEGLHRNCPRLKVLATSQSALGRSFEHVYPVYALPVPQAREVERTRAEELLQYDALRLFIRYAAHKGSALTLTEANKSAIASLCRRLDGIPLALELAAARTARLPIAQLAAKLEDSFALLSDGPADALEKHRTLNAAIAWSYRLLAEAERKLLLRLTVFRGGWTLEAAETICAEKSRKLPDFLQTLSALVESSLVEMEHSPSGDGRYRLLESVRLFLLDLPETKTRVRGLPDRHSAWFQKIVVRAKPHLESDRQRFWMDLLEAEQDNLREALRYLSRKAERLPSAMAMANALRPFWIMRGHWETGRRCIQELLTQPEASRCGREWAEGLSTAGFIAYHLGDYDNADRYLQASREACREENDARGEADALRGLGDVAYVRENWTAAEAWQRQALALYEALGNEKGKATVLNNLGNIAYQQGQGEQAGDYYDRSRQAATQGRDKHLLAMAIHNQAMVANSLGDRGRAGELYRECLQQVQEIEDQTLYPILLYNLGGVALRSGEALQALQFLRESLFDFQALGDLRGISYVLGRLAQTLPSIPLPASLASASERENVLRSTATILGMLEALRENLTMASSAQVAEEYAEVVEILRAELKEATLSSAWQEGKSMLSGENLHGVRAALNRLCETAPFLPRLDSGAAVVRMLQSVPEHVESDTLTMMPDTASPTESDKILTTTQTNFFSPLPGKESRKDS
jgi:predicted ATPase/class 3 adenylate cyclase